MCFFLSFSLHKAFTFVDVWFRYLLRTSKLMSRMSLEKVAMQSEDGEEDIFH